MKKSKSKISRLILGSVFFASLFCFYPGDMVPLPLLIYEDTVINTALSNKFNLSGIGAKLTLVGQVMLLWALVSRNQNLISLGRISTILLMIGIPLIMNYRNVRGWEFEFTTWIPFFLCGFGFLYLSMKLNNKENDSQHR